MKKLIYLLLLPVILINLISCDPENVIGYKPNIDSDTLDYVWDTTKVVKISLNNTSIACSSKNVTVSGTTATITAKGSYEISGTLNDGQIVVDADGLVRLILKNADITNSKSSPIFVDQADKAIIILPEGTTNTITDAANYIVTADSLNAAIFSKDYMAISGKGKLIVNANYNTGISCKDELIIQSGNIDVKAVGAGIKGKDYLKIYDGNITVVSGGDALKSDNDSLISSLGYVDIENGVFALTTANDGISATNRVNIAGGSFNIITGGGSAIVPGVESTKGIKAKDITISGGTFVINSSDNSIDAENDILINNGTFTLYSADKPLDCDSTIVINNGDVNIAKAEKGISGHHITFNGGKVTVVSKNDCIKATLGTTQTTDDGSSVNIKGGTVLLSTEKGDALDSNGSISISAGVLAIQGSQTSPDDAISYRGTCLVSGGTLAAVGATSLVPSVTSTQNSVSIRFSSILAPGTVINIQDASGVSLLTYKVTKYAYSFIASVPALAAATTYNVYTGGSTTGTSLNGYYSDGVYTPGTKRGSFTVSGKVTSVTM